MSNETPDFESMGDLPTGAYDALSEVDPQLAREQKAMQLNPGDVVGERFEILGQLGFGGMGAVYKVQDNQLNEERALKIMLPSLLESSKARERFLEEIKTSQKLAHPGIVRVHDLALDKERGFQFFTMELIEGVTLGRRMHEAGGKLQVDEAMDVMGQLCDALEYAHAFTIHRDLKPQNIMVQPDGKIKVLDFGLAKMMTPGKMNKSSMALGTAYYQAPEQSVHLKELDQRADIYSLGVIFYQMLTGEIPVGIIKAPSAEVKGIPRHLDGACMKCLEAKMENRHADVNALRDALSKSSVTVPKFLLPIAAALLLVIGAGYWMLSRTSEREIPGQAGDDTVEELAENDGAAAGVTQESGESDGASASAPQERRPPEETIEKASGRKAGDEESFDGIDFVWIPPGSFQMGSGISAEKLTQLYGSDKAKPSFFEDELPQHEVTLTKGFWMSKYEITNGEFRRYDPDHQSIGDDKVMDKDDHPVVFMTWDEAQEYISWLNRQSDGRCSLPTEAQWEYACRAGTTSMVPWGELDSSTGEYANVADRTGKGKWDNWSIVETTDGHVYTAPVGSYRPNAWGLHDMIGNVYEWCEDRVGDYSSLSATDPEGPPSGANRAHRGGSWFSNGYNSRSAGRGPYIPNSRYGFVGIRVVRTP